jgi:hypothetical protein
MTYEIGLALHTTLSGYEAILWGLVTVSCIETPRLANDRLTISGTSCSLRFSISTVYCLGASLAESFLYRKYSYR